MAFRGSIKPTGRALVIRISQLGSGVTSATAEIDIKNSRAPAGVAGGHCTGK